MIEAESELKRFKKVWYRIDWILLLTTLTLMPLGGLFVVSIKGIVSDTSYRAVIPFLPSLVLIVACIPWIFRTRLLKHYGKNILALIDKMDDPSALPILNFLIDELQIPARDFVRAWQSATKRLINNVCDDECYLSVAEENWIQMSRLLDVPYGFSRPPDAVLQPIVEEALCYLKMLSRLRWQVVNPIIRRKVIRLSRWQTTDRLYRPLPGAAGQVLIAWDRREVAGMPAHQLTDESGVW